MSQANHPQQWLASGLLLGSMLSLAVLMAIPQPQADAVTYLGLGAGLLLAIASLVTFFSLQVQQALTRGALDGTQVEAAVRQGVEIAGLIVGGLFLRAFNGLTWLEVGYLAAALLFAEIALSLRKQSVMRS